MHYLCRIHVTTTHKEKKNGKSSKGPARSWETAKLKIEIDRKTLNLGNFLFRARKQSFLGTKQPLGVCQRRGRFSRSTGGKKGVSTPGKVTGFLLLSSAAARSTPETPQRHRIHLKAAGPLLGTSEFQLFPQFPHPPRPSALPLCREPAGNSRG